MKIKVAELHLAYPKITSIISEKREMPMKAQYRFARLHAKLAGEFKTIAEQWDKLVMQYGKQVMKQTEKYGDNGEVIVELEPTGNWEIEETSESMAAFRADWQKIADEEIDVDIQPIPLECLGDNGVILSHEFIALGPLVTE